MMYQELFLHCAYISSISSKTGRKPSNESGSATAVADPERKWRGTPIYTAEWSR
jgi:hypothetical protein